MSGIIMQYRLYDGTRFSSARRNDERLLDSGPRRATSMWGFDYDSTNCTFRKPRLFKQYLARGAKLIASFQVQTFSEITVGESMIESACITWSRPAGT